MRNDYCSGGEALTVITVSCRSNEAQAEHFWYDPQEAAALRLEVANMFFAAGCAEHHALPPTSTHFH